MKAEKFWIRIAFGLFSLFFTLVLAAAGAAILLAVDTYRAELQGIDRCQVSKVIAKYEITLGDSKRLGADYVEFDCGSQKDNRREIIGHPVRTFWADLNPGDHILRDRYRTPLLGLKYSSNLRVGK